MTTRACPTPVQAVARAARFQTVRNTLVAAGAVLTAAFSVTATLVWPMGQHSPTSCPASRRMVTVHPFTLPLDTVDRSTSVTGARVVLVPSVSGCVDHADLTPIDPQRRDLTSDPAAHTLG